MVYIAPNFALALAQKLSICSREIQGQIIERITYGCLYYHFHDE
jgi:hypothetical protein